MLLALLCVISNENGVKHKIDDLVFDLRKMTITPFPCPFSVLAIALFIYYISVPAGTESRTEVK